MRTLGSDEHRDLIAGATVVSRDDEGQVTVLRLQDGTVVKCFRHRRLFSSSRLRPYAVRFVVAARRLRALGVNAPRVLDVMRIPSARLHAVRYEYLPGRSVREVGAAGGSEARGVVEAFAAFVASLHETGVYFRGMHLGNVLELGSGDFALIDVVGAQFTRGPLPLSRRLRNLRRIALEPEDAPALASLGPDAFLAAYFAAGRIPDGSRSGFVRNLARRSGFFRAADAKVPAG